VVSLLQTSNVVELLRKLKTIVVKASMDYVNGKLTVRYNDGIHDYVIEITCKTPESCKLNQ